MSAYLTSTSDKLKVAARDLIGSDQTSSWSSWRVNVCGIADGLGKRRHADILENWACNQVSRLSNTGFGLFCLIATR